MVVTALAAQATSPTDSSPPTTSSSSAEAKQGPQTGSSTYVDLEGGAGYSSNPNLSLVDSGGAGFGRISAHAVHTRTSARTATVISAYAQELLYTHHYGSQQSFSLSASHSARATEKLRVFGDLDASYDKGDQLGTRIIEVPFVPILPGLNPPILLTPVTDFLSITGRTYRASGHVGAQLALGEHDFLDVSTGIDHVVFKSGQIDTRYTIIPVSIGYSRQISPRTTLGARVVGQHTEYNGPTRFTVVTPEATFQTKLSENLTVSGDVGASFASVHDGISTHHSTGLAADVNLCSVTERGQFCARASIDQQAATAAGPARNISVGVDYTRRLDAAQTISFSLSGSRYSSPTSVISGLTFSHATYVRAAADYTRKLGNRWFGGVTVAARKVTESGPDPKADISGSLYIRYRFGDVQ